MKKGKVLINVNDIIGKRLGKLKVISYIDYYMVECDCGTIKPMQRGQLVSEVVHSCGCARRKKRVY